MIPDHRNDPESPEDYATRNMTQAQRIAYRAEQREKQADEAATDRARELEAALELAPAAVMGISDDGKVLTVCAWPHCHGPDAKGKADAWGAARGYTLSHGMCQVCFAKECPETVAANKAMQKCIDQAKELTSYAEGLRLDLRVRRAELLGVSLDELARRDSVDLQQQAQDALEQDRQEDMRRHYFQQSADFEHELATEGASVTGQVPDGMDDEAKAHYARLASIHSLPMGQPHE